MTTDIQTAVQRARAAGMPEEIIKQKIAETYGEKGVPKQPGILANMWNTFKGMPALVAEVLQQAKTRRDPFYQDMQVSAGQQLPTVYTSDLDRKAAIAKKELDAELLKQMSKTQFIPQKDVEMIGGDKGKGALYGAKKGAGTASYFVPGGGVGESVGARIATATGRGMLGGGMYAAGQDVQGDTLQEQVTETLKDVGGGALTGGATAGVLQTVSELPGILKGRQVKEGGIKQKVNEKATKTVRNAQAKKFGKPKDKYGGMKLYDVMDDMNVRGDSIDNIVDDTTAILNKNNSTLQNNIKQLKEEGVQTTTKDVLEKLKDQVDKTVATDLKTPKEAVYKSIFKDLNKGGAVDVEELYRLKQNYGALRWDRSMDKARQQMYETAYHSLNDTLDSVFKLTGREDLRLLNKNISSSIRILDFVEDQAVNRMGRSPIGLYEIIGATGGLAAGGPVGGIVGPVATKVATSPDLQMQVGNLIRKATQGGVERKVTNMLPKQLSSLAGGVPQYVLPRIGAEMVVGQSGGMQPQATTQVPGQQAQAEQLPPGITEPKPTAPPATASQGQGLTPERVVAAMQTDLAQTGGKNISKLSSILDAMKKAQELKPSTGGIDVGELTEKQQLFYGSLVAAKNALNILQQNKDKELTGPLTTGISRVAEITPGSTDINKTRQQLRSQLALASSLLKSPLIGSQQSEMELKNLADALASATSQEDVTETKLVQLIGTLNTLLGQTQGVPTSPGMEL